MTLNFERNYPLVAASIATGLWCYFHPPFPTSEKEFLGAAISIGAILTGFIATAKAILAALSPDSAIGRLHASGYTTDLVTYLRTALYTCLFFSVYGLFGFFLQIDGKQQLNAWYSNIWIFLAVWALMSFHRVANLLLKIIAIPPKSNLP